LFSFQQLAVSLKRYRFVPSRAGECLNSSDQSFMRLWFTHNLEKSGGAGLSARRLWWHIAAYGRNQTKKTT